MRIPLLSSAISRVLFARRGFPRVSDINVKRYLRITYAGRCAVEVQGTMELLSVSRFFHFSPGIVVAKVYKTPPLFMRGNKQNAEQRL